MSSLSSVLIAPAFEKAYWRALRRRRFREYPGFSKKKGHYEPEDQNTFAGRWAMELTREESAEEIRQVYEACVNILANKRSCMERSERDLDCEQFRFSIEAVQDPTDPEYVRVSRLLWIKSALNELPRNFDDLFPESFDELVVPVIGRVDRREILETLEHWETKLKGRISESADQNMYRLHLGSGFVMSVDIIAHEVIFSKTPISGPLHIAVAVAEELKSLGVSPMLKS